MMKDRIKNYFDGRDRQAFLVESAIVGFIAAVGLALVYTAFVPCGRADADNLVIAHQSVSLSKDASRKAVLSWMERNSRMPRQVLARVYSTATKSVHPDLVLAICVVESNFNPRAVSDKGAMGLMGVMPSVWLDSLKARGIVNEQEDLYEIPNNIASGVFVLKWYMATRKNLSDALRGYSGGDPLYAARVLRAAAAISQARRAKGRIYLASAGQEG
jgi:hypothetical protein